MSRRLITGAVVVLLVAALLAFPYMGDLLDIRFPTSYELRLLMRAMILAIVVIGLNILVGYAGLVSLGQAAPMPQRCSPCAPVFPSPPAWSSPWRCRR
jgi:ABC-type branched-subunit amino acid transport system permease subunit